MLVVCLAALGSIISVTQYTSVSAPTSDVKVINRQTAFIRAQQTELLSSVPPRAEVPLAAFPLLAKCGGAPNEFNWEDVRRAVTADEEPFPAGETRRHLDSIVALLQDPAAVQCYRSLATSLFLSATRLRNDENDGRYYFIDLGSRRIDSTTTFLQRYPSAAAFDVLCFEANPAFNSLYPPYIKRHPRVRHYNLAVGVRNTTLRLSHRDVGSSVLDDAVPSGQGQRSKDFTTVKVVSFSEFLLQGSIRRGSFVVIKMDIEKMEFAVLHQMIRTGSIFAVRELLLECHYNTNLPPARRNRTLHIGKDDCFDLVAGLPRLFPRAGEVYRNNNDNTNVTDSRRRSDLIQLFPPGVVPSEPDPVLLEAVLWNSKSTVRASNRFMERHGGFYPT